MSLWCMLAHTFNNPPPQKKKKKFLHIIRVFQILSREMDTRFDFYSLKYNNYKKKTTFFVTPLK